MDEELTYQTLKEILPQLEIKLRETIQQQYQQELHNVQNYYQQYAQEMVNKKQIQLRREMENNQSQLRKELTLIQRQRQQWLVLENNYKKTITQLTQKLKIHRNSNSNISALTQILPQYNLPPSSEKEQGAWKKNKNDNHNQKILQTHLFHTEEDHEQSLVESRPLQLDHKEEIKMKGWKVGKRSTPAEETEQRARRQDTMVLSPPKTSETQIKGSVLDPPPSSNSMKSSVFWNQEGKKKLLSMIRSIK